MKILVLKQIDGDWYRHGTYSNLQMAAQALVECSHYAEQVQMIQDWQYDNWISAGRPTGQF